LAQVCRHPRLCRPTVVMRIWRALLLRAFVMLWLMVAVCPTPSGTEGEHCWREGPAEACSGGETQTAFSKPDPNAARAEGGAASIAHAGAPFAVDAERPGWYNLGARDDAAAASTHDDDSTASYPTAQIDDNFLTDEECDAIIALAKERPESPRDGRNHPGLWESFRPGNAFMYFDQVPTHPVIKKVEQKVADWTGVLATAVQLRTETGIKMKRQAQCDVGPANSGAVHLDASRKPLRRATVIFYCSDVAMDDGGATVLPCLVAPPVGAVAFAPSRPQTEEERTSQAESLAAREGLCRSDKEAIIAQGSPDPARRGYGYTLSTASALHRVADDMCAALARRRGLGADVARTEYAAGGMGNGSPGVFVQPKKGRALMFRDTDHALTWHSGCEVYNEGVKWNGQKFKNQNLDPASR